RDMELKERQPTSYMSFIAQDNKGLVELHELVSLATEKFYYVPRLDYNFLWEIGSSIIKLSGNQPDWTLLGKGLENFYVELNQLTSPESIVQAQAMKYHLVATQDNLYCSHSDLAMYQVIMGDKDAQMRTAPAHILEEWEWRHEIHDK